MQTMDSNRTEERIDNLSHQVGELSRRVDDLSTEMRAEFKGMRDEMHANSQGLRDEMQVEFRNVRAEFREEFQNLSARLEVRFDSLHRSMLWMMGTMLVVVASILASAQL